MTYLTHFELRYRINLNVSIIFRPNNFFSIFLVFLGLENWYRRINFFDETP